MKRSTIAISSGRSLAPYIGIFAFAMAMAYVAGLATRAHREAERRGSSGAVLSMAPEGTDLSSIILGGAATVSQHRAP